MLRRSHVKSASDVETRPRGLPGRDGHLYLLQCSFIEVDMARDTLGIFEHQILSVLLRHPRDAYGATLQERIEEATGRDVSIGALYTSLDRLERKGFVSSWWGEPTAERGGRRKRYYKIEASGAYAVRRTEEMHMQIGGGSLLPQGV